MSNRERVAAAAILVVALAVRLVAVVTSNHGFTPYGDESDYLRLAASIRHGHGFTTAPIFLPGPSTLRPPAYPLVLAGLFAVTGTHVLAARLLGCALGVVSVALFGVIGRRLGGRNAAGLAAMGIAAIYPSFVIFDTRIYAESVFLPLFLGALILALHAVSARSTRSVAAAAALGALSWLTRPDGSLTLVIIALLVGFAGGWRARERAVALAVGLAVAVVVIAPWTIRNVVRFHHVVPVTDTQGYGLAGTFNPQAMHEPRKAAWIPPWTLPQFHDDFADPHLNEVQVADRLNTAGIHFATHHPAYVASASARNVARIVGVADPGWVKLFDPFYAIGPRLADAWLIGWDLLLVLLLAALPGLRRRPPPMALLVGALLFLITALASSAEPRYREPIEAIIVILVASGLAGRRTEPLLYSPE